MQLNLSHHGKQPQRRVMADGIGDVYGNGEHLVWFRCWCWVWVLLLVVLLLWFFLVFA